jgi:hypothetical protein
MKYIDRALVLAVAVFFAGALIGAFSIATLPIVRQLSFMLLQSRMVSPMRSVSRLGDFAVLLVIFINNSIPVILSFIYPITIAKIKWTPPLTARRRFMLLAGYTFVAAFLVGFFSLGAPLGLAWVFGGFPLFASLLLGAQLHGPIEFGLVLVCVAEPLRIAQSNERMEIMKKLSEDWSLVLISIAGLLLSAAIEVFAGI